MKEELVVDTRGKLEKLLELCLTRAKLQRIERSIGTDFDLLKQTLIGCFVRVLVQGRPMLSAIQSVEDCCQIEWAWLERRLFLPQFGYFKFGQIHPEIPRQDEMARWCQRRKHNKLAPLSMEFIEAKLALLKMSLSISSEENRPTISTQMEPAQQQVRERYVEAASISDAPVYHMQSDSDQNEEEFEQQERTSMSTNHELPNVEGLVQDRELLAQVLLPCKDFLAFFTLHVNRKDIVRATVGCLMAFRIAGNEENSGVIVDEIIMVKRPDLTTPSGSEILFKFGHVVNVSKLVPVEESKELTDPVFDQWLQRLTIRNEPLPDFLEKRTRKMFAIAGLAEEVELVKQLDAFPDISPIVVTASQLQSLVDNSEPRELSRLLVGCFVMVQMKKYELELEKHPKMRGLFVVPIVRVRVLRSRATLYFSRQIPICHRQTGKQLADCELQLQNIGDQRLGSSHKLVGQSLLMMAELKIPLPSDEEVARKCTELNAALAKASHRKDRQVASTLTITSGSAALKPSASAGVLLHSLPNQPAHQLQSSPSSCCSVTAAGSDDVRESRVSAEFLQSRISSLTDSNKNNNNLNSYEFFFHPPVFFQIPMAAAMMGIFSSSAGHSSPYFGPIDHNNNNASNDDHQNQRRRLLNGDDDALAKIGNHQGCSQEIASSISTTDKQMHEQLSASPSAATNVLHQLHSLPTATSMSPSFFNCQQEEGSILIGSSNNNGEQVKKKKRRIGIGTNTATITNDYVGGKKTLDEECGGKRRYNLRPRKS